MSDCDNLRVDQMRQMAKKSGKMPDSKFWKMNKKQLCAALMKHGVLAADAPCVPCVQMSKVQAAQCFGRLCKKYPGILQCKVVGTVPVVPKGKAPVAVAQISTATELKAIVTPTGEIRAVPPPAPPPPPPSVLPKIKAPTAAAHKQLVKQAAGHKAITPAGRGNLMAQIQAGKVQLRKMPASAKKKAPERKMEGIFGVLQKAMAKRRVDIKPPKSNGNGNGEWDV